MHCVARRETSATKDNLLGALDDGAVDSQHLIDNAEQGIKCRLNCIAAVDSHIPVQDLLQHCCIRDESLAVAQQAFYPSLRVYLMRM